MNLNKPHTCHCNEVSKCSIFIHPDKDVQLALNNLMDAMAKFDDSTKSKSILRFKSVHPDGTFSSITKQSIPQKLWHNTEKNQ